MLIGIITSQGDWFINGGILSASLLIRLLILPFVYAALAPGESLIVFS